MTIESVVYISDFNTGLPAAGDLKSEGDDHIRNIKAGVKTTFPNVSGVVGIYATGSSGVVGIGAAPSSASGLEVLAASNSVILRQTSAAGYAGMRVYNDQNSALRSLELDYTGSAYASGLTGGPTGEQGNVTTTGNFPLVFGTNNTARFFITGAGVAKYDDRVSGQFEIGFRTIPPSLITTGTIGVNDVGKVVNATAGVTIPNAVFSGGDVVTILNTTAGNITITQGASHTLRLSGTATTGNRTLAQFGVATVLFLNGTASFISGAGLS